MEATKRLNHLHSVNVVSTLMGAHAVPPEYCRNANAWVDLVTGEMIPNVAAKGLVAVLLPAFAFSMMVGKYADARMMIDNGFPVALGTGFDACCWMEKQQLVMAMTCYFRRMTPAEAITAATINAAYAVNRAGEFGSLEVGKRADVLILGVPNPKFLGYRFGVNLVDKVIKNGRLIVDLDRQDEPIFLSKTE